MANSTVSTQNLKATTGKNLGDPVNPVSQTQVLNKPEPLKKLEPPKLIQNGQKNSTNLQSFHDQTIIQNPSSSQISEPVVHQKYDFSKIPQNSRKLSQNSKQITSPDLSNTVVQNSKFSGPSQKLKPSDMDTLDLINASNNLKIRVLSFRTEPELDGITAVNKQIPVIFDAVNELIEESSSKALTRSDLPRINALKQDLNSLQTKIAKLGLDYDLDQVSDTLKYFENNLADEPAVGPLNVTTYANDSSLGLNSSRSVILDRLEESNIPDLQQVTIWNKIRGDLPKYDKTIPLYEFIRLEFKRFCMLNRIGNYAEILKLLPYCLERTQQKQFEYFKIPDNMTKAEFDQQVKVICRRLDPKSFKDITYFRNRYNDPKIRAQTSEELINEYAIRLLEMQRLAFPETYNDTTEKTVLIRNLVDGLYDTKLREEFIRTNFSSYQLGVSFDKTLEILLNLENVARVLRENSKQVLFEILMP